MRLPQSSHSTTIRTTTMDDFDAFIDYVDTIDESGEVTVSGVDSGIRNQGKRADRQTRSTARAFAALPSPTPYRPRTARRGSTAQVGISRESNWERNQPKNEKTDWASTTVQLPIVAPFSETKQIKHHIHRQTVERIKNTRLLWQDKNDFLLSRFIEHAQLARTEAKAAMKELLLYENECYVFEDAELLDRNAAIINVAGAGDYNNNIRQRTRYIRFTLVIRPRDIDTNSERVTAETLPRTVNQSVYLRTIKNNQNGVINAITRNIIETDLKQSLEIWEEQGEPFDIMM
jgi:hypothetical protein